MGEIWLSDLARAWAAVGARTEEERHAVARLLGLGDSPLDRARLRTVAEPGREPASRDLRLPPEAGETAEDPADEDTGATGDTDEESGDDGGQIRRIGVEPVTVAAATTTLPRPGGASPVRPHLPLIDPRLGRSVLQELLAQPSGEGPIDVDALVRRVASHRVTGMPRRPSRTLRFGVQVLSDEGDGMAPFAKDQEDLIQGVRDLVGDDITSVVSFADAPLRGAGDGPVWTWTTYRPPPPGSRVLVLSHLGIGGPWPDPGRARRQEWTDFAELVGRAACRAIVLVPYPLARVPGWAFPLFPVLSWDRTLTVWRAAQAGR